MRTDKIKITVGAVLVILALFFVLGKESKGQEFVPVRDAEVINLLEQLVKKEYELDPAQRELAGLNLNNMTDFIVTTLESMGRKGDINDTGQLNLFVNNWRNFALEGQYRAEDLWRGLLYIAANGDPNAPNPIPPILCRYIRESQAFNSLQPTQVDGLIENVPNRRVDSLEEYLIATKCDPIVENNYDTFIQDFNEGGGWDMWERLLQPQNNIYGSLELANEELIKQRSIEEQSDLQEANSGSGYLGRRQCLALGQAGQCVIWSNVNIPADLAVETLGAVINQNLGWIVTTDEAGENPAQVNLVELIERIFGQIAPEGGGGGGGGGLTCAEKGLSDNYQADVKSAANKYLVLYPEIANESSSKNLAAVAQLRDGIITILIGQGFNAKKVASPQEYNGEFFYPQMVWVWKSSDPDKTGYRITAGGGIISEAIKVGYCDGHEPF